MLKQDVRRALEYWCRSQGVCKVLRVLMLQELTKIKHLLHDDMVLYRVCCTGTCTRAPVA